MKMKEITIAEDSLAYKYLPEDYFDAFECAFTSNKEVKADDVLLAFWSEKPEWINWLFRLRNFLVKPFKLDANKDTFMGNIEKTVRTGNTHGDMSVPAKSDNETLLRINDKHLTMYLSILVQTKGENYKAVIATTLVHFHNTLGKFYFAGTRIFHKFVVKSMLKYVIKKYWL